MPTDPTPASVELLLAKADRAGECLRTLILASGWTGHRYTSEDGERSIDDLLACATALRERTAAGERALEGADEVVRQMALRLQDALTEADAKCIEHAQQTAALKTWQGIAAHYKQQLDAILALLSSNKELRARLDYWRGQYGAKTFALKVEQQRLRTQHAAELRRVAFKAAWIGVCTVMNTEVATEANYPSDWREKLRPQLDALLAPTPAGAGEKP